MDKKSPTLITYTEWQSAYDFFNKELFNDSLPECVITLSGKSKRNMGSFAPDRYASEGGEIKDGLMMNPKHFRRGLIDTLSTLVHEMCHVWIHHFGKTKSRNGYHSKEWGTLMESVGLMPSKTGQQMTHYIIDAAPFETAAKRLLEEKFRISWADAQTVDSNRATKSKARNKSKYSCKVCKATVWGKPELRINCGECKARFVEILV